MPGATSHELNDAIDRSGVEAIALGDTINGDDGELRTGLRHLEDVRKFRTDPLESDEPTDEKHQ